MVQANLRLTTSLPPSVFNTGSLESLPSASSSTCLLYKLSTLIHVIYFIPDANRIGIIFAPLHTIQSKEERQK
jgi:hypothetical protein